METNKTGIVLIRLQPYTNYSFYVRAHANGVISEPSKFVSQTTNEEDCKYLFDDDVNDDVSIYLMMTILMMTTLRMMTLLILIPHDRLDYQVKGC